MDEVKTIRCFIALELPVEIKTILERTTTTLRKAGLPVRWVSPDHYHITVHFLGDISTDILPQLIERISTLSHAWHPITCELKEVMAFPDQQPRMLCIETTDSANEIQRIFTDIKTHLHQLGIKTEARTFFSHITLGRIKRNSGQRFSLPIVTPSNNTAGQTVTLTELTIIRSVLLPNGPEHTALTTIPLRKKH